ncbi:ImmA/IrrE family metallo-endopeptidase [Mesorhizobium amorphae]|uniref:ImmA/IrrE family metallo-endopeptidase n=1 Tax=Mesorhizobium amorphae TaxID=71433 RepID=UPI001FEF03EA|nr:ImmA/IrrE family metallo-endopeptidase [Mesorhizobium amorphae]
MAENSSTRLRKELRRSGLSSAAIDAAWPAWWNDDLSESPSARAELRFALARKLGLAPKPLLGERVEFVWKDKARFKHLGAETEADQLVLSSFAMSVGRLLTRTVPAGRGFRDIAAEELRSSILRSSQYVDLRTLAGACWGLAVPVVHLRVFPLAVKAMHAMVIADGNIGAIMLGRDASYPAPLAFTLAHEIGHLALGHVRPGNALVDVEDPALANDRDEEEQEADAYALTLLTGSPKPEITTEFEKYNAPTLASAVVRAGAQHRIEPGTLALCIGHLQRNWPVVMSALGFIYPQPVAVWKAVNALARTQIDWSALMEDDRDFVYALLNLDDV